MHVRQENIQQVHSVLGEIGAIELPMLEVYNKIDLIDGFEPQLQRDEGGNIVRVWISAQKGLGLDLLEQAIAERLGNDLVQERVVLEHAEARLRAQFYAAGAVLGEQTADDGRQQLDLRLQRSDFNRLLKREGWLPEAFLQQHTLQ